MAGCLDELIESQNRLYRLLDTHITGQLYTANYDAQEERWNVTPAIPPAPPATPNRPISYALDWQIKQYDNAINGTTYNGLPVQEGIAAQLRQILQALQTANQNPEDYAEVIELLGQIALLLA